MMKPIGTILSEICGLSEQTLNEALRIKEEKGGRIGQILLDEKMVPPEQLYARLAEQMGLDKAVGVLNDLSYDASEHIRAVAADSFSSKPR